MKVVKDKGAKEKREEEEERFYIYIIDLFGRTTRIHPHEAVNDGHAVNAFDPAQPTPASSVIRQQNFSQLTYALDQRQSELLPYVLGKASDIDRSLLDPDVQLRGVGRAVSAPGATLYN